MTAVLKFKDGFEERRRDGSLKRRVAKDENYKDHRRFWFW